MTRAAILLMLVALNGVFSTSAIGQTKTQNVTATLQFSEARSMTDTSTLVDLFNRWEQVWHEERYDLISGCVGDHYIRHDQKGDRTVTRAEYAMEIEQVHKERPGIRVVIYDHAFEGNRAWFRFAFKWTDPKTNEPRSMAGFQSYRTEGGKLVETWLSMQPLGSAWPDKLAQPHWTSPSPVQ